MYRLNENVSVAGTRVYVHGLNEEQQKGAIDALRTEVTLLFVADPDPIPKRQRKNDGGRVLITGTIRSVREDKMILERAKLRSASTKEIAERMGQRPPLRAEDLPRGS